MAKSPRHTFSHSFPAHRKISQSLKNASPFTDGQEQCSIFSRLFKLSITAVGLNKPNPANRNVSVITTMVAVARKQR